MKKLILAVLCATIMAHTAPEKSENQAPLVPSVAVEVEAPWVLSDYAFTLFLVSGYLDSLDTPPLYLKIQVVPASEIPGSWGETQISEDGKHFRILLNQSVPKQWVRSVLLHEVAHVASVLNSGMPVILKEGFHGKSWGLAYAELYQLCVER